jgi:hypothetical protein
MKTFVTDLTTRKLRVATNGKDIHQTDRNTIRAESMAELYKVLEDLELEPLMTADGVGVEVELEDANLERITLMFAITIKNSDYDLVHEANVYQEKLVETAKAKAEKEAKKVAKVTPKKKAE